ncbi:MAG TPA: mercuric reductase [Bryobacteraceae bacterium]|jgi:pyruvate/2-oxoglutarate dehydrogenase complex dihydrolipoamide dehydrogenase (E3) component
MPSTYDAIVIGSGQGGNPLAVAIAGQGAKVALIESDLLGGTCINTGCTPTKTMVASAQVAHYARNAARWGVRASEVSVDLPAILRRKDEVVEKSRSGWPKKFDKKVDVYRERARFIGMRKIQAGERTLEGERIFIDTGAAPTIPQIDGLEAVPYLTNVSLLELKDLPEHLIVLGGGYIGLEFGQMFRRFGSDVTVVHRGAHILEREDEDVTNELQKCLEAEGVRFELNARATKVEMAGKQIRLTVNERVISGSHLLVATGRSPRTKDLDLGKTGVQVNERGYIVVNDRLETSAAGIWAMGDVNGGPAFTHISYNDYQIVYGNLYEGKNLTTRTRLVPYAVFTDPTLGRVGLSEKEARATGRKLKIGKVPMTWVARAIERAETAGFMKLVVDASNDHILGAAILASEGGELVQILGTLMLAEKPYTLLKGAIYIHPTLAEGFFALMDSVKPTD